MKALLGLTAEFAPEPDGSLGWFGHFLLAGYTQGIREAEALPVVLPLAHPDTVAETLFRLDGLILTGGAPDIPPDVIGEPCHPTVTPMPIDRWNSECLWFETARATGVPILGICLGMQVMNVADGGKLVQDIPDQLPGANCHSETSRRFEHLVSLAEGSRLASIAPSLRVPVTSSHHQAIKDVPSRYRIVATSDDGIIEAIEDPSEDFVLGVQWHPERNPIKPDWLLHAFAEHCAQRRARLRPWQWLP